ncbi:MAG: bifunctional transaldolase/phosoglucose isomerase [Pseudomonadota bacterium]
MTNSSKCLSKMGQSIWYDNLSRDILRSGHLKKVIDDCGISGVSTNPAILEQAINGTRTYDNDLHALVDEGADIKSIFEGLIIPDVRETADLLLPLYRETQGMEGYVNVWATPDLAYDAEGTRTCAARLFDLVDRPNLMVRIAATEEGLRAAVDLLAQGVNLNMALVSCREQYDAVVAAYMEGLDKWFAGGGQPPGPVSVASITVSRVDVLVDELLHDVVDPMFRPMSWEALGRSAIANAGMIYAAYRKYFDEEPFERFNNLGARPQRLVWTSTGVKNPAFIDTYYVNALVAPGTITAMPPATLEAFLDHSKPGAPLLERVEEFADIFLKLQDMGVDLLRVGEALLDRGIRASCESMRDIYAGIDKRRTRLLRGWGHRSASLGELQQAVEQALQNCDRERLAKNVWESQPSVWKEEPAAAGEIIRRLGWLQSARVMQGETERLKSFTDSVREDGFTTVALIGSGGSILAAEVFRSCLGVADGYPELVVVDTTVPAAILEIERSLDLEHTLFIVSSKSGRTIEAMALFRYFWDKVEKAVAGEAGQRFVAITDPGTALGKLAAELGFRKVFLNPPDIGGRYSALSYFGLVPAALIGADIPRLLMRAAQAMEGGGPDVPALENPSVWLGVIMAEASGRNMDKLTFVISPNAAGFGSWLEELIAESTGKERKGVLPVTGETDGEPENYGRDRLFIYLRMDNDNTHDQFVSSMERAGHPVVTLRWHSPYDLGREIFRWEFATAIAGAILKLNPFDQPNVQESKELTRKLLELHALEGGLPAGERIALKDPDTPQRLMDFMGQVGPGDYVAINAFLGSGEENRQILQKVRMMLRDRHKTATSLGFGPRYLHSTGQFHKGGPTNGLFIMITADDTVDVPIPGQAYGFSALKAAQALGDYEALKRRGRRVVRIHLDHEEDLMELARLIEDIPQLRPENDTV